VTFKVEVNYLQLINLFYVLMGSGVMSSGVMRSSQIVQIVGIGLARS
jgi:hypothetical protein